MHSETPWDETYSVGEVASALGIPRSTLLYYETHGIVRPSQADETGYRAYATPDLVRLMGGVILKNAGVRPRDMDAVLDAPAGARRACGRGARRVGGAHARVL